MSEPTIVVTNGTANEGYWAVYYLLKSGRFNVRATVRRPASELAQRLRDLEVDGRRRRARPREGVRQVQAEVGRGDAEEQVGRRQRLAVAAVVGVGVGVCVAPAAAFGNPNRTAIRTPLTPPCGTCWSR